MVEKPVMAKVYAQMTELNRYARDVMTGYEVHACTDVTGFALLGHGLEMAQGSGCSIYLEAAAIPYHREAYELASMGFVPAGAYRNREFAEPGVWAAEGITRAMMDILYDPQTSGGLLFALPEQEAQACLRELRDKIPQAAIVGYVTEKEEAFICLH